MKTHARVVVIGGGIAGCSTLYHLTKMGWSDVVLVERDELTSGSTWHAAGNCPNFSTSWNIMKLQAYSNRLYAGLGEEVDYPIAIHRTGSVRLAHSPERMEEFQHACGMAQAQGLGFEMLSPNAIREFHPYCETHDLQGALWDPDDGDVDPAQLTQALAKGARDGGAEIYRQNPVEAIAQNRNGEWLVQTRNGTITAEIVVNAAGYRAGEIGELVGLALPIVSMQHQYLVSEAIPELEGREEKLPLLRDPDVSYYLRQERHGLLLGPYEWDATLAWPERVPEDFAMELFPDSLDRLEWYIEQAMERVPLLAKAGIQRVINGPIPYTPDGNPLIGPAYPLENFYLCAAFSFGIVQGGGAGKAMAEIIVEGESEWDLWGLDSRRYGAYATKDYTAAKAIELYQNEYAIAFPYEERPAGRPAKTTPVYGLLQAKGARFGARGGWERALWFAPDGQVEEPEGKQALSFHHAAWHQTVGEECRAVRERAGLLDLGGFAKYQVTGPGAAAFLDRLITGRLPQVGRLALSYFCNERGGLVSELTITRLAEGRFYLCSAATAEWYDHHWMLRQLAGEDGVSIANVTGQLGTLVLAGPDARRILSKVTDADLSNQNFPWLAAREITIGFAPALALRVSYVGELGWELHVPLEHLLAVYQALMAAGAEFEIADFGMYAMDSLRLEKCYRAWKLDLTLEYSPLEAGLERFVRLDKAGFIGRAALLKQKQEGLSQRLVPLLVESDRVDSPFCASVFQNGKRVGLVGSSGYGHWVGKSIALAYLQTQHAERGTELEVEIYGQRRPCVVAQEPLYDPENLRLKS